VRSASSTTERCSRDTEPWCAEATGVKSVGVPPPAPAWAISWAGLVPGGTGSPVARS